MSFFVMLNTQSGGIAPLVSGEHDEIAVFETAGEAADAARQNVLGRSFGAKVFDSDDEGEDV